MGIISGSGSFQGRYGDHFRVGDHFGLGNISGAVQYSEGKIHMSEPESGKGNVNAVYFVNQARGNTQISRMEFVYDE